jgi:hypothetical protein
MKIDARRGDFQAMDDPPVWDKRRIVFRNRAQRFGPMFFIYESPEAVQVSYKILVR